jgi:hypothetical protein
MTIKTEEKEEEIVVVTTPNNERKFPDVFYDPLTNEIMKDPVVDSDGDSHERSVITAQDDTATYYPNRALKAIMEREIERSQEEGSIRGSLRRWDESIRSKWGRLVERSALPIGVYRPLPEAFYCPITCELITTPVIDPDGNTYEKAAIINWIGANGKSPITRNDLSADQLYDNNALDALIDEEKERTDESIHPSIRRWKATALTPTAPLEAEVPGGARATIQTYPTTPAEIEARRRQHRQQSGILSTLFFIVVLSFFVVPYFFALFVLGMAIFCCTLFFLISAS